MLTTLSGRMVGVGEGVGVFVAVGVQVGVGEAVKVGTGVKAASGVGAMVVVLIVGEGLDIISVGGGGKSGVFCEHPAQISNAKSVIVIFLECIMHLPLWGIGINKCI